MCRGLTRGPRLERLPARGVPSRGTAAGRARPPIQMKAQTKLRAGPGIGSSMSLPAWKRKNTFGWMALPLNYLDRWLLRQRQSSCESFPEGGKETASGTILTHLPRGQAAPPHDRLRPLPRAFLTLVYLLGTVLDAGGMAGSTAGAGAACTEPAGSGSPANRCTA